MSEGPTTVGSINAYLELNIDRFLAKAAEAQAVADGLEKKPIKAKVTADTAGAEAGLKRVAKGANEVESATKKVEAATKKAATAQEQFAKAGSQAMPALIGGLVAISAAAPPVAAAAVGLTGAFGVMAGAGILGLSGIVRGLKENNAVGKEYRGTVNSLADSFHALQDSAAQGLFPGVQKSATMLKADMPVLNGMVQHFAGLLGADLPIGLDAVVTLLQRATPLFDLSAGYINRMFVGLDAWAHGSGFQQFLDYAITSLPEAMKFLGDVIHLAGDFVSAWAPLGTQTLPMLDGIITGLDDIIRATGPLVPAIVVGVGAFKMLQPVIAIIQGVTTALRAMTVAEVAASAASGGVGGGLKGVAAKGGAGGGVGLMGVLGPIALGATAVVAGSMLGQDFTDATGLTQSQQQYSKAKGSSYVNGINQGSPFGNSIKNLSNQGSFGRGLAQGPLGGLLKSNVLFDAMGLNNGINAAQNLGSQDKALAGMVGSGKGAQAAAIFKQVAAAAKAQGVSISDLKAMYPGYTAAVESAAAANQHVGVAVDAAAVAYDKSTTAIAAAAASFQSQDSAANAAKDAMANVTASVKANGHSLDENTVKGRANAEAVSSAVVAIQAHGAAMVKAGHSTAEAAVSNDKMAISLEHSLESMGVSKAAATAYINKLMGIPKNRTTEAQLKIDKAKAQAEAFDKDMKGKNYTAILKGDFTRAQKASAQAAVYAEKYAKGDYKGIMRGDFTPAQKSAARAKEFAVLYAKGDYKGILKGDFTPAQKAAATAHQKAMDFAKAKYMADLKANPTPANVSSDNAAKKAHAFAAGRYDAVLRADNTLALSTAAATVAQINAMRASIQVSVTAVGGNGAQIARNYTGAHGGTAGSGSFGSIPGMAYGGTPGGTISGPGHAASDLAGLYRLANGEEVISNLFGQADRWRPLLKAINAGRVTGRTFDQLAQRMGGGHSQPTKVTTIAPEIHVHNPVAVDPVTQAAEATQYALAYAGLG